jgi:predicted regulator of Ras-like GTPase activity (Roadblock/LC7/MglB family)
MQSPDIQAIYKAVIEVRGVEGVFMTDADGFLTEALNSTTLDPEAVASMTAIATQACGKMGTDLKFGSLLRVFLEFENGKLVIGYCHDIMIVIMGSVHMVAGEVLAAVESLSSSDC